MFLSNLWFSSVWKQVLFSIFHFIHNLSTPKFLLDVCKKKQTANRNTFVIVLYISMFNTKRFELSEASGENQKQAREQILVFNHLAFTKASGLITEQWNVTSRLSGIVCEGGRGGAEGGFPLYFHFHLDSPRLIAAYLGLGKSIFLCR